jgi:hypothetical protein
MISGGSAMADAPQTADEIAALRERAKRYGSSYTAFSMVLGGEGMTRVVRGVSWFIAGMAALAVGSAVYASILG